MEGSSQQQWTRCSYSHQQIQSIDSDGLLGAANCDVRAIGERGVVGSVVQMAVIIGAVFDIFAG